MTTNKRIIDDYIWFQSISRHFSQIFIRLLNILCFTITINNDAICHNIWLKAPTFHLIQLLKDLFHFTQIAISM
uniref:Uncharacterized protein n=1 Tax=Arundo donax TaxID=35708 RepID=A0A0A9EFD2_ARUDO